MRQIIYLDHQDHIATIRDKLQRAQANEVLLVIPPRYAELRDLVIDLRDTFDAKGKINEEGASQSVKGMPTAPLLANFSWSPDQKKMAFTQTTGKGVEIWVIDLASATAKKEHRRGR